MFLLSLALTPLFSSGQSCPVAPPVTPPWLTAPALPYRHVLLTDAGPVAANVYVRDTGAPLGRPFVFIEGIDFGLNGADAPLRLGDFGWAAFHGCDPVGYPMMAEMPTLLDSIMNRGFHPVLIDFEHGAGNIMQHAALVADIVQHLRAYKTDPRPMVVSGASMGGQIARIALALMERAGDPHCTQLYLSLDSPHAGANVPIGLQQLIAGLESGSASVGGLTGALQSPAAQQLLLERLTPSPLRAHYQAMLDSIGWPQYCRNAAIANGALTPLSASDAPLLSHEYAIISSDFIGDIGGLLDLEVYPFPGKEDHPMTGPVGPVTSLLEMPGGSNWPWPLDLSIGFGSWANPYGVPSLDLMPGGTRPSMAQFVAAFNAALAELDLPWPLSIPSIEADDYMALHSFIPTPSALGIPHPWGVMNLDSVLMNSPFDTLHCGLYNEPHSEINPANTAFVLHQLDYSECPIDPGMVSGDQVLNAGGDWSLPSLDIAGRLCLQSADAQFGLAAAAPGSSGDFILADCGSTIRVLPEGVLELGGGTALNPALANLTVPPGGRLEIEGKAIVHPGSALHVAPGGTLVLRGGRMDQRTVGNVHLMAGSQLVVDGASLWTQGPLAQLFLNGQTQVWPSAEWVHHLDQGARIHTTEPATFFLDEGSATAFKALTPETHWRIAEGGGVDVTGSGDWTHHRVGLRLMDSARWTSALSGPGTASFLEAQWIGTAMDSLSFDGTVMLLAHEGQDVHMQHRHALFRMEDSRFNGGSITLSNDRIRWSASDFDGCVIQHLGLGVGVAHLIESCRFANTHSGLDLQGPGRIRIEDTQFESNAYGIAHHHARVEVACTDFVSNDVGILSDRGLLVMQPEGGGGWNRFEHNDTHMRFQWAPIPAIIGGANHFGDAYSDWASGSLDITCSGSALDWDISGQSWDWPTGWPQVQSGLWAVSPDGGAACPVSAVDLSPIPIADCRALKEKKGE